MTRGQAAVLILAMLAAGCGGSPGEPTSTDLRLSCPAPQTVGASGQTAVVTFEAPTVTGGRAPVSVSCSPPSGASFPLGTSTVTCTARDSQQHSQSCGFAVTVQRIPVLSAVRFVAFGDSITYGSASSCDGVNPRVFDLQREFTLLLRSVDVPASYPAKLQTLLAGRYTTQSPVVLNEGQPAEIVQNGLIRLPGVLSSDAPQALLLQEGANNVNGNDPAESARVANGLGAMVRDARQRGIQVFVATLLPERADGCRARAPSLIAPTNDLIRSVAIAEGATLVDLYQVFVGMETTLLGIDGLHPSEAGYQKMAETFLDAIRVKLETRGGG
jgi:lysophospholipase L1-like esterase